MSLTASLHPDHLRVANWFAARRGVFSYLRLIPYEGGGVEIYACDGTAQGSAGIGLLDQDGFVSEPCAVWFRVPFLNEAVDRARERKLQSPAGAPLRVLIEDGEAMLSHRRDKRDCYGLLQGEPYPDFALSVPKSPRPAIRTARPSVILQKKIADTTKFLARIAGQSPEDADLAHPTATHHDGGDEVYSFEFLPSGFAFIFVRGKEVRPARPFQIKVVEAA